MRRAFLSPFGATYKGEPSRPPRARGPGFTSSVVEPGRFRPRPGLRMEAEWAARPWSSRRGCSKPRAVSAQRIDGVECLATAVPHLTKRGTLVAIGNFDGVHRGHQAVVAAVTRDARTLGLQPILLTFDPHPSEVLGHGKRSVLTPLERKVELLASLDPELKIVVEPFTLELAQMSAEEFARRLLVTKLHAKLVIVGRNFRFGYQRSGTLATLERMGTELGFHAKAEDLVGDEAGPYSSTRARDAVSSGDLELAETLLGRPHAITGLVVRGDGRGRTIGVPTANLSAIREAVPPDGVYACLIDCLAQGGVIRAPAVANLGVRPTVAAGPSVEVHVLDYAGDLYGARLRVHLLSRLRDERAFSSLEELVTQIRRDIAAVRARLLARGIAAAEWVGLPAG